MAGYSGTPLLKKLGIKPGFKVFVHQPPKDYFASLGKLPEAVEVLKKLFPSLNFIHFFALKLSELKSQFPSLKKSLAQDGMLWVSWPKTASKVPTDVTENLVRQIGLESGLVDVKVCAVDEVWSGLKFVYRLKDRK